MRYVTVLLPLAVLIAIAIGWSRARLHSSTHTLPAFAPSRAHDFPALAPPLGDQPLRGRVVDIDGNPVAGVDLYLRSDDVPSWTTSDEQGRFAFERLGREEVQIAALLWGRPPKLYRAQPGGADVELVLSEPLPPPVRLQPVERAPLAGRVAHPLGRDGFDPEGYEVAFLPRAAPSEFGGAVERRVRCDARGFFFVEDLALGTYDVAVLPIWAAGTSFPDLAASADALVEHTAEATDNVVVGLSCGALEGALVGVDGEPIHGAMVLVATQADAGRLWPPQASDGLGRFRFADLPPGSYRLTIRAGESALDLPVEVADGAVTRPALAPLVVRKH